jgi:beta-phosphoglucomutase-like phosphatase (HAD superfamily)
MELHKSVMEGLVKGFQKDAADLCFRKQETRRKAAKAAHDRQTLQKEEAALAEELRRYEAEQQRLAEKEEFEKAEALTPMIEQVTNQGLPVSTNSQSRRTPEKSTTHQHCVAS